jgi:hypothetical protein
MLNPAIALTLARAREAELRGRGELLVGTGGDEDIQGRRHRCRATDSPSAPQLLVWRTLELIRLADSLDCQRDELVRMIRNLP